MGIYTYMTMIFYNRQKVRPLILRGFILIMCLGVLNACSAKDKGSNSQGNHAHDKISGHSDVLTDLKIDDITDVYPPGYDSSIAQGTLEDFQKNIGDRVFFVTDSTSLTPQAVETLQYQVKWIRYYNVGAIQIEGHADERGTREYNLALSARRASVVKNFMISQGLMPDKITIAYFGKERPVSLCDAPQCWDKNRRAVIVINQKTLP